MMQHGCRSYIFVRRATTSISWSHHVRAASAFSSSSAVACRLATTISSNNSNNTRNGVIRSKKIRNIVHRNRNFSTQTTGDRLRVAVVGGGVSGLATALHLAPLVSKGLIDGPIDVFDRGNESREIGVGVWSTAMDPFLKSEADSHRAAHAAMQRHGTQVGDVGYRTPQGHWLAQSHVGGDLPSLLFLREMDLVASLREGLRLEEERGNVVLQTGKDNDVERIDETSTQPWSARLQYTNGTVTDKDYHLIITADGMNSNIRKLYGGHLLKRRKIASNTTLPGPIDLPTSTSTSASTPSSDSRAASSSAEAVSATVSASARTLSDAWDEEGQSEAVSTQDREYTVFRGNSLMSTEESGLDVSFQTWGEGRSQRFAVVPMVTPDKSDPSSGGDHDDGRTERQVWFITINDDEICSEEDPLVRRTKLLEAFADWHDPIRRIVEATPPDQILMERAVAHKHCMIPVTNFNQVIGHMRHERPHAAGNGPAIVFVGDSFMTIDPILAQGFTIGMEGAAALAQSLEMSLSQPARPEFPSLAFDPKSLREGLNFRHEQRLGRLICLLRATEIVQALGQPTTGTLTGMFSKDVLRPLMRIAPGAIKTPVFNAMMKYSLGLPPL